MKFLIQLLVSFLITKLIFWVIPFAGICTIWALIGLIFYVADTKARPHVGYGPFIWSWWITKSLTKSIKA
jgi:hypothetical protein